MNKLLSLIYYIEENCNYVLCEFKQVYKILYTLKNLEHVTLDKLTLILKVHEIEIQQDIQQTQLI